MIQRREFLSIALTPVAPKRLVDSIALDRRTDRSQSHWQDTKRAIDMGSLQKPFLVVAYARTHTSFPSSTCKGTVDQCWLPHGHGSQNVVSALAHSCNAYFLRLAAEIQPSALEAVCLSYDLRLPGDNSDPSQLIGLAPGWKQRPEQAVAAFSNLMRDQANRGVAIALEGMRLAAAEGTAKGIQAPAFAKTGTAGCTHLYRAVGDGFVVVLYPCSQPRLVLLVRQHATTGAQTAFTAGSLLRSLV